MQSVDIEEGVCGKSRVGGDESAGVALAAGDKNPVVEDFGVVVALVILLGAFAVDFALGVEVVDDEHDHVADLRIGDRICFLLFGEFKAFDPALFHEVEKFELAFGKLGFDEVRFAQKGDVDSGIGAGEGEEVFAKKERRGERKMVIAAAEDAGDRQMNFPLVGRDGGQLAFFTGAFEFDHSSSE